jgi:hypothetical protein
MHGLPIEEGINYARDDSHYPAIAPHIFPLRAKGEVEG